MDDAEFRRRLEDPNNWAAFAEIQFAAAGVLWNVSEVGRTAFIDSINRGLDFDRDGVAGKAVQVSIPFMMLSGLGTEALLKATVIRLRTLRKEPVVVNTKKGPSLHPVLKTHDLATLAKIAEFAPSAEEALLLARLTEFVEWAGRYPAAVTASKVTSNAGWSRPEDLNSVKGLMNSVTGHYNRTPDVLWADADGVRCIRKQLESGEWEVSVGYEGDLRRTVVAESLAALEIGYASRRKPRGREFD